MTKQERDKLREFILDGNEDNWKNANFTHTLAGYTEKLLDSLERTEKREEILRETVEKYKAFEDNFNRNEEIHKLYFDLGGKPNKLTAAEEALKRCEELK